MQKKSIAQIVALSAIWGASFLLIRIAGQSFPPFWIALMRSSLGALLLWSVFFATRHTLPARRYFPWLLLVALFNNAIPFTCFAWGERVVPSNTAAVLNATTPIFTLLLGMLSRRTRAARNVIGGVVLGFAGVLLVVMNQSSATQEVAPAVFYRGVALITFGALGYAVATVIAKARLQGVDPMAIAASQLGLAAVLVSPLAAFGPHPANLHLGSVLGITVLGLVGSGLAYLLFFHILHTVPATHAVAVTYLLPIWGVFWGVVAGERIGLLTCIGVAVVIAGLGLMNLRPASAPARIPAPSESLPE